MTLYPGNAELLYYKQMQDEEERIMNLRIANFLRQKQEREAKNRAEAEAVKAAKQKGIDHIAKAQKVYLQMFLFLFKRQLNQTFLNWCDK